MFQHEKMIQRIVVRIPIIQLKHIFSSVIRVYGVISFDQLYPLRLNSLLG